MIKKTILLAMLVSALFACDDKETTEDIPLTGINNVTLNVGQSAFSRGVNGQKGASEYAVLGSGKLYFLNSSYTSIFQRQLTPAEVTTLANTSSTATSGKGLLSAVCPVPHNISILWLILKQMSVRYFPLSRERQVLMPDYAWIVYKEMLRTCLCPD